MMFSNLITATIFLGCFIFAKSKWLSFSKTPPTCFIMLMSSVIFGACSTLLEEHAQPSDATHGDSLFSKDPRKFPSKTDLTNRYSEYRSQNLKGYNELYQIKDIFLCEPCVCSGNSFSLTSATCQSNGALNISTIPNNLPRNINTLFVKLSDITVFNGPEILPYSNITSVHMNKNPKLYRINSYNVTSEKSSLLVLDLSDNNITIVEENSFKMFSSLNTLSLSRNQISFITISTLNGLGSLKELNFSKNQLLFLENSTFDHLKVLEVLDLSQNPRLGYMPKHFPRGVFSSLQNLNKMFIEGNAQNGDEYPNLILQQLKNLAHLSVDGINSSFSAAMKSLNRLSTLFIGYNVGKCNISHFNDNFFENFLHLKKIKIKGCSATRINMTMFLALRSLRSLGILNMPHYDLYDALDDLQGVVKSSMIELQLSKLTSTFMCRILDETHAKYLQYMRLKHLDLSDNSIVMMTNRFSVLLPKTLEVLILKNNKLNPQVFVLQQIKSLIFLNKVDLGFQSYSDFATVNQEESSLAGQDIDLDDDHGCPVTQSHHPYSQSGMVDSSSNDLEEKEISIPERLQILLAPQYLHFGLYILFCKIDEKSNLHRLDFYSNFISHWGSGELPKKVKIANFADNHCRNLTKHFFSKNNELEILLLRNNVLGDVFATDSHGEIFSNLGKLHHINLSKNSIHKIPREFFHGLKSVEIIILSQNNIQVLNVSFANTMNLKFINLSRNSIFAITKNTLNDLDNIAVQNSIFVDLTMNPLPCTCTGLPLIFWLASTNVYLLSKDFLTCVDEENNVINIGNFQRRLKSLQRHCASKELTQIVRLFSGVFIALIVSLLILYRFRWRLRYLRTVAIVKLFGFEPKLPKNPRYKYDAYIIYTDETRNFALQDCVQELEVKRGHRLCIEERDFMPGTYTVSAIVSAVQNSAKTVPVVTPEFYEGEYAEYSLKMAVMEEIFSRRSVLHLCIYQPVSADDMTRDLLAAMKKNHFTEFPADDHLADDARLIFWNDMSSAIGRNLTED